jgi:hypothetical protein
MGYGILIAVCDKANRLDIVSQQATNWKLHSVADAQVVTSMMNSFEPSVAVKIPAGENDDLRMTVQKTCWLKSDKLTYRLNTWFRLILVMEDEQRIVYVY